MLNPNVESGGGPFARGRAKPSAMGVWRTPKDEEYANPEGLVGRKVRVYFDGDCTFFEAQVHLKRRTRGVEIQLFQQKKNIAAVVKSPCRRTVG